VKSEPLQLTALNIPADHPARDMQDTFYLSESTLLRTHTHRFKIPPPLESTPPAGADRGCPQGPSGRDAVMPTSLAGFTRLEVLAN